MQGPRLLKKGLKASRHGKELGSELDLYLPCMASPSFKDLFELLTNISCLEQAKALLKHPRGLEKKPNNLMVIEADGPCKAGKVFKASLETEWRRVHSKNMSGNYLHWQTSTKFKITALVEKTDIF